MSEPTLRADSMTHLVPDAIVDTRSTTFARLLDRLADLPGLANRVMRIDTVDASALPALFEHFGISALWDDVQSDAERRALIREALTLHRRRGTLSGLKRLAELVGSEIVTSASAPAKVYCGASLTAAEREAYLASHPALQLFPYAQSAQATGLFLSPQTPQRFARFTTPSTASTRFGGTVQIVDPATGQTQQIDHAPGSDFRRLTVRLPDKAKGLFACGYAQGHFADQQAAQRYFSLDLDRPYADDAERWQALSLQPSIVPITGQFTPIALSAVGQGLYGGVSVGTHPLRCTVRSTAPQRFGRELRLFDPNRAQLPRRRLSALFANGARLSRLAPYHGELMIDMHRKSPASKAFAVAFLARRYCTAPTARAAIDALRIALKWAARGSERIAFSTAPYQVLTVSPVLRVGEKQVGQYLREPL